MSDFSNRRCAHSVLVLILACVSLPNIVDCFAQSASPKVIRNIIVTRHDVFPEITGQPRFLYEWANSLHIVTREHIIRQELLFKEGDLLDPDLLEESERKLRALAYFGAATITVAEEGRQFADISVVTQDQWSTLVSGIFQRGGGRTIFGGSVEEFNMLGFGKRIFSEVRHERAEGTQFTLRYTDPQVLGSRWTTEQTFISGPFIKSYAGQIIRPFFALDTEWAGGMTVVARDDILRLFDRNVETSRLSLQSDGFQVFAARAFGERFQKKKIQLTYRFLNRNFSTIETMTTTELPEDELIHSLSIGLSFENLSFIEEHSLDKFLRTEDLTLGNTTTLTLTRTGIPVDKGVKRFEFVARRREAHEIFSQQYFVAVAAIQTLFDKDTIASLRLQYYNQQLPMQTWALNFEFAYTENLEVSRQFVLGGDVGLRGYPAREFNGVHKLLLNIEDRIFTNLNILTVALGGVLFMDAGNVWRQGETISLADLNYSIGFGLRLGYTKSPNSRVGRIDFGWPLNRGGGFGVFVGVDQQFSLN